jgi:hypothetical protein
MKNFATKILCIWNIILWSGMGRRYFTKQKEREEKEGYNPTMKHCGKFLVRAIIRQRRVDYTA